MNQQHRITVTVAEDHRTGLARVSKQLQEHGMEVEQVLESLGMVTGTASDPAALRGVEGVQSVDEELEFHIPGPDEEIQ